MSLTLKQRKAVQDAIDALREIRDRHSIGGKLPFEHQDHETYDIAMWANTTELERALRWDRWNLAYWIKRLAIWVAKT